MTGARADRQAGFVAAAASAAMIAFQLAGKATRDALFLSTFGVAALPRMVIVAAVLSALLSVALARVLTRVGPVRLVPALFGLSALLLGVEWLLVRPARPLTAVLVYLHFTGFGALLVSGFWALVNERFDPRAARGALGRITAGASLGGLLGGILPERVGAALELADMLPLLALLHLLAAVLVVGVGRGVRRPSALSLQSGDGGSGFQMLGRSPYLQRIALLVTLTAAAEGTLDYVFKLRATTAVSSGEELLRLFAAFYTATALLGILVQVTALRRLLQVLGVARSAAVLPAGVTVGAGLSLALPGLGPVLLARGAEVMLRSSLFRAAYELMFTPVAPREKRAVKLLLDVGAARVGDVAAGGLIQATLAYAGAWAAGLLLGTSMVLSGLALAVARRLHLGYTTALAGSLRRQSADLPPAAGDDAAALLQTAGAFDLTELRQGLVDSPGAEPDAADRRSAPRSVITDRRGALRSRQPEEVRAALREGPLSTELVEDAVGLLAWDAVAADAILALRESAGAHVPLLVRHLLDPEEDFAVRRRLVTVLADQTTPEALDGLVGALDDQRFEVRYRAGRALRGITERMPPGVVERERLIRAVLREVTVDRSVWQSRRLIDAAEDDWATPVAHVVRERANRSLEHVFTLLSLFLPRATIQLAYQGLNTDDPHLRGTALEYLETVLPDAIRQGLWPFLEVGEQRAAGARRPAEEVVRELLASRESIVLAMDAARSRVRPPTG